jgi:hypothetical protein
MATETNAVERASDERKQILEDARILAKNLAIYAELMKQWNSEGWVADADK